MFVVCQECFALRIVEKTKWRGLIIPENIQVLYVPKEVQRVPSLSSLLYVSRIHTETNRVIEVRTKGKFTAQHWLCAWIQRISKVVWQSSFKTFYEMPVALSDSIVSWRSSKIAECNHVTISNYSDVVCSSRILPCFFQKLHVGCQHIRSSSSRTLSRACLLEFSAALAALTAAWAAILLARS